MSSGEDTARPEVMRSAAGNVGGLVMQATGTLHDFDQPDLDPDLFASIGSSVSSADAALHDQQVAALSCVLSLLLQGVSGSSQHDAGDEQGTAAAQGGRPTAPDNPLTWSSAESASLACQATRDSGPWNVPTPHRAESVIGYLAHAGLHEARPGPGASAGDLAAWLDDRPDHQAQLGVIAVYAGPAGGLHDTPERLRAGDLVCIEPGAAAADREVIVGVVGEDGGLYNHGLLSPDFGGIAEVRVYRMIGGKL